MRLSKGWLVVALVASACDGQDKKAKADEAAKVMSCQLPDENGLARCFEYQVKPSEKTAFEGRCKDLGEIEPGAPAGKLAEEPCPTAGLIGSCETKIATTVQKYFYYRGRVERLRASCEDGKGTFTAR
jgi:hypothetical protein